MIHRQDGFSFEQIEKINNWRMERVENMAFSNELAWREIQKEEWEKRSLAEKEAIFKLQNKNKLIKEKALNELKAEFLREIKNRGFSEEDIEVVVKFRVEKKDKPFVNKATINEDKLSPEDLVIEINTRYFDTPFYYLYWDNYTPVETTRLYSEGVVKLGIENFFRKGEGEASGYDIRDRVKEKNFDCMSNELEARVLLKDQSLIPKEWRDYYLIFPGNLWGQNGRLYMPYLDWNGKRWELKLGSLISKWFSHGRVVLVR